MLTALSDLGDEQESIRSQKFTYLSCGIDPDSYVFYDVDHLTERWGRIFDVKAVVPEAHDFQTAILLQVSSGREVSEVREPVVAGSGALAGLARRAGPQPADQREGVEELAAARAALGTFVCARRNTVGADASAGGRSKVAVNVPLRDGSTVATTVPGRSPHTSPTRAGRPAAPGSRAASSRRRRSARCSPRRSSTSCTSGARTSAPGCGRRRARRRSARGCCCAADAAAAATVAEKERSGATVAADAAPVPRRPDGHPLADGRGGRDAEDRACGRRTGKTSVRIRRFGDAADGHGVRGQRRRAARARSAGRAAGRAGSAGGGPPSTGGGRRARRSSRPRRAGGG